MINNVIASLSGVSKIYSSQSKEIIALQDANVLVRKGELLLILGPSGSGKTTLLSLLGCLINPTIGQVKIGDLDLSKASQKELANVRLHKIGFVFQQFNLVSPLNAIDNVLMPLLMAGKDKSNAGERGDFLLDRLGLLEHKKKYPKELSGGQQQRVAIARALVNDPELLLCDEPTASLDKQSVEIVMQELRRIADSGNAVAVVTHDARLEKYADRIIQVVNGNVY